MAHDNNKKEMVTNIFENDHPTGEQSSAPITPKMLIKALKKLKKKALKGLFFNARDVTCEILQSFPQVEQDFQVLYFEVSDKLACAAAAGIIGLKQDHSGYYAFNSRQTSNALDYRSELMFWVLYKRLLSKRTEEFKILVKQEKKVKGETNNVVHLKN